MVCFLAVNCRIKFDKIEVKKPTISIHLNAEAKIQYFPESLSLASLHTQPHEATC